ncbi:MAG: telomere resolvase [Drouetiella hepatica Uher 2000/2452]|jgi:hypothetical protein|uniref:Telomere resolvase n=1 Tax=Drouetiella hepatica Uher 2000/2452 TaxID=904376 RepID=A0A951UND8_9CYAN|nr:telomere resolvase [Drouetiella hepatica Uher 2000/2452]
MSSSKWLEQQLKETYLPLIATWQDDQAGRRKAKKLLKDLRSDWTKRELITIAQQKNCMAQVRRAIKDEFGEDHFSLDHIKFSTDEYTDLNSAAQARVSDRNENVQYLKDPEMITAKAVRLLESKEWAEIAAGLSVLTGRRVAELVSTAHFEPKSKWSVMFTGAKKRGSEAIELEFEIPTLTTAAKVCDALSRLRKELPETAELDSTTINRSYSQAVAKACDTHFSGLIPLRSGRDNLYTHISRSVYATIAVFWYCPPAVNEAEFKAAIQGHYAVLNEKNVEKRRSLAAGRHYSDYEIADELIAQHKGKRKGIKLGLGGITVIDAFKKGEAKTTEAPQERTVQRLRLWQEDREALESIFDKLQLSSDSTQMEKMGYLVSWIKERLEKSLEPSSNASSQSTPTEPIAEVVQQKDDRAAEPVEVNQPFFSNLEATLKQLTDVMTLFLHQQQGTPQVAKAIDPITSVAAPTQVESSPSSDSSAPKTKPTERKRGDIADERLVDIMHRIFAYNDAEERLHTEKWAVTIGLLKQFVKSQPRLQKFLADHEPELTAHYKKHAIDPEKQNYKHRGKDIREFINFG